VARFRESLSFGWKSGLAGTPAHELTCERIFRAAAEGDTLARHVVAETGRYLGVMAANLANLLNPERCIFAGGMIRAGDLLFDAIREECAARAFPAPAARMTILPAALGRDAGLIGAAGCALTAFETSP
jgi:glucokinase